MSAKGGGGLVHFYGDDARRFPQKTSGDQQQPGHRAGMLSSCSNGPGWLHVVADHSAAAQVAQQAVQGLPTAFSRVVIIVPPRPRPLQAILVDRFSPFRTNSALLSHF